MARRIAFVHYPHWPAEGRLDTMPFSMNMLQALAAAGFAVDLYLSETDLAPYTQLLPSSVRIYQLDQVPDRQTELSTNGLREDRYSCAFGVGQIGVHLAHVIAERSACPLVYLNDEFPSNTPGSLWFEREQMAAQAAALIVLADECRAETLYAELGIPRDKPFGILPNVTNVRQWPQVDWRKQLGLPPDSLPFMHAGSVDDWTLIPELMSTVPLWPSKAVLVIHSRVPAHAYRNQVSDLEIRGRIVWSLDPVSEPLLNSMTSFSVGTFALYQNRGANIELMGYSAGKIMRSIVCNCPVIASRYESVRFIEEHSLGILIERPAEIPSAVDTLITRAHEFRRSCAEFSRDRLSFDLWWDRLRPLLTSHAGLQV